MRHRPGALTSRRGCSRVHRLLPLALFGSKFISDSVGEPAILGTLDGTLFTGRARYDGVAEWYLPWVGTSAGLICDPAMGVMAEHLDGQRWLDAACGAGRTSRELARRSGVVVGIDLSERLIAVAEEVESSHRLGITYRAADITAPGTWWDGRLFDGVVCEMALMDIDDLVSAVATFRTVVRPAGALRVSIVNPCFPGNEAGLSSWPPDRGYSEEGYWTSPEHNPDGIRVRVGSSHRTLATYLNTFLDAGFGLERAREPKTDLPTWLVLAFKAGAQPAP